MHQERYQQAIALAGVFQAAELVNTLAHTQQLPNQPVNTMLSTLFNFSPRSVTDVYGGIESLEVGIKCLNQLMSQQYNMATRDTFHYGFGILHLEKKLENQPRMLDTIRIRLEQVKSQSEHYAIDHDNIVSHIADIYKNTLSSLKFRIRVKDPNHYLLNQPKNADMVRALLLTGIRSAKLWRQLGGSRWHFVFGRKHLIEATHQLLIDHQTNKVI